MRDITTNGRQPHLPQTAMIPLLTPPTTATTPVPRSRCLALAPPALIYIVIRAFGIGLTWLLCVVNHRRFDIEAWDGYWYLGIAQHGYRGFNPATTFDAHGKFFSDAPMAFFPGYPLLVHAVAPVFGFHYLVAGVTMSILAGIAAAYGVARLARNLDVSRRGQLIAVALVAGAPMSVVLGMPYPEALLVALAAWVLVAVLERRWWWAGAGTAVAGLVSPMAAPLIPVVIAAALIAMYRGRASLAPAFAAIVSPLGMIGYLLFVHQNATTPGGYFGVENRGWDTGWDFGWTTLRFVAKVFAQSTLFFYVATAALVVASIAAVVVVRRHLPWPVWSYCLFVVALALGSGGFEQDRGRLLLAAFPLAIPAANALTRMRTRTAMTLTGLIALAGLWFGAYSLSAWTHGI